MICIGAFSMSRGRYTGSNTITETEQFDHMGDASGPGPGEGVVADLQRVLASHAVSFAMLFGSSARRTMDEHSDLDVAFEFDTLRPDDDGYSDAYLRLVSELDAELPLSVDLVDVHSMPPSFARVAFDEGEVILGSETRRAELERAYAGEPPSLEDARDRVAAAAERLREGSS